MERNQMETNLDETTTTSSSIQQNESMGIKPKTSGIGVGKQIISETEKQHLNEVLAELNKTSSENSKFIRFEDGDSRTLKVLPELTSTTTVNFETDPTKAVPRCRFMVYELVSDQIGGQLRPSSEEPKEWTASISVAKEVIKWNQKGYRVLQISREGKGLKTKWFCEPVVE